MSGTDATGIPARDGDGNTIPAPIAPAPVNPVAPPPPLAQDVSDTVILTAIGTLTSALGDMAPAPRTPGTPNAAPRVDFFRNTTLEEGDDSQTQLVKILNSLHNVSFSQLLIQESMMRGQILALRAQEGHAKLIVNSIQKLVDSFQRIDPSQTAGTLEEFGNSFGSLADTLKDLFSGQRVKESLAEDQRRRVLAELSTCKNVLEHIRTNTQNISKSASNSAWELRELRTGGPAKDSGEVDAQRGSLLATLGVLGENSMSATIEHLGKLAADLRDAIEKGTEPTKSLKRKHEEAEYAELMRQKEELQKEHERTKKYSITHPITQQQLLLTIEEQRKMFTDLASTKPEDFAGGHMGPSHTGSFSSGSPNTVPPGFPPGVPVPTGYPVAPASLPVLRPPSAPHP